MIIGSLNAFSIAYTQSDFFGKLIILSLIGLSMVCWIVLLYKTWILRKVARFSLEFQSVIAQNKDSLLSFDPGVSQKINPFGAIFQTLKQKTIEILNKNHYFTKKNVYLTPADLELLESHVTTTISAQNKMLEKHLYLLSTIVTLAPFMGLLGTVWGILVTFSGLHEGGTALSSNSSILGGISTALATTVMGLVIAIPALIAYNYLRSALRTYTSDMDDFLTLLLSNIELQYRKVE